MAAFIQSDITESGINIKAKGETGKEIRFTSVCLGDGFLQEGQDTHTMTALVNELMRLEITGITLVGNGEVEIRAPFTNAELQVGFSYRELGLFARDPDTNEERLYCYANAGEQAEWIPPSGGITVVEKIIKVITITGRAANVVAQLNSGIYITSADLDAHNLSPESHPDIRQELAKKVNKESYEEYDLDFIEGISAVNGRRCAYSKDPFNRVYFFLQATTTGGGIQSGTISTLPEGFKPAAVVAIPATGLNSSGRYLCTVDINPDGQVMIRFDGNVGTLTSIFSNGSFIAND